MRALKCFLIVLTLALVTYGCWLGWTSIPASISYGMRSEFSSLPGNDKALETWLKGQPGVARVGINRNDKVIEVFIIQVRNGRGEPPLPDLDEACAALGYAGQVSPFTHFRDEDE
jgi:hypothetical protein